MKNGNQLQLSTDSSQNGHTYYLDLSDVPCKKMH